MLRPRVESKDKLKKNLKGKCIIFSAMIIWLVLCVTVITDSVKALNEKENVVEAFCNVVYSDLNSNVSVKGYYGNIEMSDRAKCIILEEIADKIGINRYTIINNQDGCISLMQQSVNGDVLIKFITLSKEAANQVVEYNQYICMDLTLKGAISSTETYRQLFKQIAEEYRLNTNVNVDLCGNVQGEMTYEQMKELKNTLMDQINGKEKSQHYSDGVYTVYGYDKNIDSYILIGRDKINVNITMNYDEINDETVVHLASPINNQDY